MSRFVSSSMDQINYSVMTGILCWSVSVYTFILFSGTSLGPILSIYLMKVSSYLFTFFLLALILGIGLLAACLINKDTSDETGGSVGEKIVTLVNKLNDPS